MRVGGLSVCQGVDSEVLWGEGELPSMWEWEVLAGGFKHPLPAVSRRQCTQCHGS